MIRNTLSGSANRCHQICGDHQPTPLSAALSRQNESGCRHLSAPRAPIWGSSLPPKSGTSAAACLLLSNPPPKSRHGGKGTDWAAAADGWGVVGGDMGQGLGFSPHFGTASLAIRPGTGHSNSRTTKLAATCKPASRIQSGLQIGPHPWPLSGVIFLTMFVRVINGTLWRMGVDGQAGLKELAVC